MALTLPPMPNTTDRRPYDELVYPGYLESDSDWAANNREAANWLSENHALIRARLEAFPAILEALIRADQFITNGVELGYISLPLAPDSALQTPKIIKAALSNSERTDV